MCSSDLTGFSILEASSMEKPVIACDTGGCPEAVSNGKTGILVPVKNVEKLTEAILYVLDNPNIAKEMSKRGREKILKEFSQELVLDRLKNEYQRLIDKKIK